MAISAVLAAKAREQTRHRMCRSSRTDQITLDLRATPQEIEILFGLDALCGGGHAQVPGQSGDGATIALASLFDESS